MTHPTALIDEAVSASKRRFAEDRSLLSFDEYLEVVAGAPQLQARDAATYVRDCFLHYGTEVVERPTGRHTRYTLFDCPFDRGRDPLVGHEPVQEAVFGLLTDFVREGRVNKLVLLHGPNGSAKTSFVSCMMRALEHYSQQPEGALYTFTWVFPSKTLGQGSIGFGGGDQALAPGNYAHLDDDDVDARLRCETRDHPLLLLPKAIRQRLLRDLLGAEARLPELLLEGDLSPKARAIYDALVRAHHGDLGAVLKHVQVERFHISRRYRCGAATVDPQMRVDAGVRQVTSDHSLGKLPPSLQNLTLFEPFGDLVDANRGVLEFNDLLKRPLEAFKYVLATCENGAARLDMMTLHLDTVFIGTSNAGHLDGFKELPDFASYKARIELVQVPYLLDYPVEARIYSEQASAEHAGCPVAPHVAEVAALWAVLTRLDRPDPERYPKALKKVVEKLTPLEKALLYATGRAPAHLPRDERSELRARVGDLRRERREAQHYEGRWGASPREIRAALLGAARRPGHRCLTPIALLDELEALCGQTTVYEFLRMEPTGAYHRPLAAIKAVRSWYLETVEHELHVAMGLVDSERTSELFHRYIDHVVHYVRKEKRLNEATGRSEEPDEGLMQQIEDRLGVKPNARDEARAGLMQRIAAWRMDNPDADLDLDDIFEARLTTLSKAFYEEKRQQAKRIERNLLDWLTKVDSDQGPDRMSAEARSRVEVTVASLEADFGYTRACAIEVLGFLLRHGRKE